MEAPEQTVRVVVADDDADIRALLEQIVAFLQKGFSGAELVDGDTQRYAMVGGR